MRRLAILLSLTLFIPFPTAAASHMGTPSLQGLAMSAGLNLTIAHEGSGSASGTAHTQGDGHSGDATYDFTYTFAWNATVQLRAPAQPKFDSPDLEGYVTATRSQTGREHETYHFESRARDGRIIQTGDYAGTCTLHTDAPRRALARAVFLPERGSVLVSFPYLGIQTDDRWKCEEQENGYFGEMTPDAAPLAMDAFAPDVQRLRALINKTTAARLDLPETWGSSEEEDVMWMQQHAIAEIPLALAPLFQQRERTVDLPVEETYPDGGRYCVDPSFGVETACSWRATVDWQLELDPCPATRESLAEHMALLRAYPAADASKGLAPLLAWKGGLGSRVSDVLGDARTLALLCTEEDGSGDALALIAARTLEYQRALLQLYNKGDRTPALVQEILAAERQLQLTGFEGDPGVTAVISDVIDAMTPQGEVIVSVHSPVSIHAWTEDGAHVGWNNATGAPEIGIEGARYEGRPGEAQTITLPAGVYRVSADELSPGAYTLQVSWDAEGAKGSESFPLDAREGRTFVTHYALVAAGEGAAMERYPAARIETPRAFAFVDTPAKPVPALDAIREPAPEAGSSGGDATATRSSVPAAPSLAALALVVAALVTARRARR